MGRGTKALPLRASLAPGTVVLRGLAHSAHGLESCTSKCNTLDTRCNNQENQSFWFLSIFFLRPLKVAQHASVMNRWISEANARAGIWAGGVRITRHPLPKRRVTFTTGHYRIYTISLLELQPEGVGRVGREPLRSIEHKIKSLRVFRNQPEIVFPFFSTYSIEANLGKIPRSKIHVIVLRRTFSRGRFSWCLLTNWTAALLLLSL